MSTTYVETAPMGHQSYHQASYPRDEVRAYRFVDGEDVLKLVSTCDGAGRAFWRDPWEGSGHYFRRGEEDVVPAIVLYMLFFLMVTSMFIFCFGQLMTSSG
ncbi:uncharacterized protein ACA1_126450 [Acanthamoeba castellanii str. Neff]|uniref:Uncharacterized protein n=1 Tax=Acanthamoeba castellanii (strain ATCC 30010 / Neff) TaxID=1257118 RepID=L8H9K4_ACACF|nr:uncharacterized protein ACA1_126450 [Acanthamoeba castellanii str. Neff]ELR22184.1 hypothetical protein ACA1_126450 [Acanthamoeba castellanii str. Neff]